MIAATITDIPAIIATVVVAGGLVWAGVSFYIDILNGEPLFGSRVDTTPDKEKRYYMASYDAWMTEEERRILDEQEHRREYRQDYGEEPPGWDHCGNKLKDISTAGLMERIADPRYSQDHQRYIDALSYRPDRPEPPATPTPPTQPETDDSLSEIEKALRATARLVERREAEGPALRAQIERNKEVARGLQSRRQG